MTSTFQMLDVAIGMIFIFLLLSLVCTAFAEIVEKYTKFRASDLEKGIRALLNDQTSAGTHTQADNSQTNSITAALYNHPLISGLYRGDFVSGIVKWYQKVFNKTTSNPSYIPSQTFALALLDCILPGSKDRLSGAAGSTSSTTTQNAPNSVAALRDAVNNNISGLVSDELKRALLPLIDAAGGDINKVKTNIEDWYNAAMDRVSGWYKRRTQGTLVTLGLLLAIIMNADSIAIFKSLSNDQPLRNALVAASQEYAKAPAQPANSTNTKTPEIRVEENAQKLYSLRLPIGWDWDTTALKVKKDSLNKARSVDSLKKAKAFEAIKKSVDSLNRKADSLEKAAKGADSVLNNKNAELLRSKATDILNKQKEGENKEAGASNKTQDNYFESEEFLKANRKLALPWYNEGHETGAWFIKIIGWFVTALAVSLGAPFWFDTLNKFIVIRSTVKPVEKSLPEASKDKKP